MSSKSPPELHQQLPQHHGRAQWCKDDGSANKWRYNSYDSTAPYQQQPTLPHGPKSSPAAGSSLVSTLSHSKHSGRTRTRSVPQRDCGGGASTTRISSLAKKWVCSGELVTSLLHRLISGCSYSCCLLFAASADEGEDDGECAPVLATVVGRV